MTNAGLNAAHSNPLLKEKTSISSAYFSAVDTMADFFNRIGRELPFTNDHFWPTGALRDPATQPDQPISVNIEVPFGQRKLNLKWT
jgi:hypothetical protein